MTTNKQTVHTSDGAKHVVPLMPTTYEKEKTTTAKVILKDADRTRDTNSRDASRAIVGMYCASNNPVAAEGTVHTAKKDDK